MEYEFDHLSIKVGKANVGWFSGMAYLEADRGGFAVKSVCLDGPEIVWLFKNASTALERELRAAIEAALYASPHVRDAWAAHVESERADAA
jgi:hypothetical protein